MRVFVYRVGEDYYCSDQDIYLREEDEVLTGSQTTE